MRIGTGHLPSDRSQEPWPSVLIAPDKFKGTLTAAEAAAAMEAGVRRAAPQARVVRLPVADGGEGTIDVLVAAGGKVSELTVSGPLRHEVTARFVTLGGVAFVEAAQACGLQHLRPSGQTALEAHSVGVGELICAAVRAGARRVVVGLGGSSCTDGGAGMAAALGVALLDGRGRPIPRGGAGLRELSCIDAAGLDADVAGVDVVAACDVASPLTGPTGAARVYGPQKGAGEAEVVLLEAALERYADALVRNLGVHVAKVPGTGAAGGLAAGLVAFLGARITSGVDLVLELLGFDGLLAEADLVLTGEGRLDEQSLAGKAPEGVARAAGARGVPALAVAGCVDLDAPALSAAGFWSASALVDLLDKAFAEQHAADALTEVTSRAVHAWMARTSPER